MARQIRTPVRQVRQSFDGLLNPIIARTLTVKGPAETGIATASAARFILALQFPIVIALMFAGKPLLASFGPEFVVGYWALLLLATAEMIQGAFGVSDLIILYHKPLGQIRITATNIAINAATGWVLIGPLGVTGGRLLRARGRARRGADPAPCLADPFRRAGAAALQRRADGRGAAGARRGLGRRMGARRCGAGGRVLRSGDRRALPSMPGR